MLPVVAPLQGEIIPPEEAVTLFGRMHPFKPEQQTCAVPAGLSVAEAVRRATIEFGTPRMARSVVVRLNGDTVPREIWDRVRLKPGVELEIRAVPGKGMGNILRSVLLIAVAIAASVVGGPLAGIILGSAATGVTTVALGAAIAGAITVGGSFLVNLLFPIRPPKLASESQSQTYSISGARNEADPYGPIPVILGEHRVAPKYAAVPYTEFIGNEQYLRLLFCVGYGPLTISDPKIGETPLSSFEGVTIEIREGTNTDTPVTLYPGDVEQQDLSIKFTAEAPNATRTTLGEVDELSIDLVAPQGIFFAASDGGKRPWKVNLEARYRKVGTTAWLLLAAIEIGGRTSDPIRQGYRKAVARGQYDVRVAYTSAFQNQDNIAEQIMWTALRGFTSAPPVSPPAPLALIALRIKATSQLTGVVDTFNVLAKSRVKAWSGSSWVANTVSRNPAALFRHVLQGPANKRPQPDAKIDLASLQAWHAVCVAKGYTFDMVRDFRASVWDTLSDIAAAGRAIPIFRDGKWSVAWDDPTAPIVAHFTPRNSWGFSGARQYRRTPHAWRVRFLNRDKGYVQDERIVYDDGYSASNATLFESIEFPGTTDANLIWKFGRFHIAQARLRPELYELTCDIENLVCTIGDRVRVTHDIPLWGLGSGRVKAVDGNEITLDDPVTMAPAESYVIRFRLADGSSVLRTVTTNTGIQSVIVLSDSGTAPAPGDLFMFGRTGEESVVLRVQRIEPGDELTARLTLADDAPAISAADTGTIPAFDSNISVPVDPYTLPPVNLAIAESIIQTTAGFSARVLFTWQTVVAGRAASFETEYRDEDGDRIWRSAGAIIAPTKAVTIDGLDQGHWGFRVRSIFADGTFSAWATLANQSVNGVGVTPGDVDGFRIAAIDDTADLSWEPATGPVSHYVIRFSQELDGATWASATILKDRVDGTFVQVATLVGTYLIKAVTFAGVESANAAAISSNIEGLRELNAVETWQGETAWSGTLEDVEIDDDALVLADVGSILDWPPINEITAAHWTTNFPYDYGLFESDEVVDLGEIYTSRVKPAVDAFGENVNNFVGAWGPVGSIGLIGGDNAESWAVRIFERHTLDDPEGMSPVWTEWAELAVQDIKARAFRFQVRLYSLAPYVTPRVVSARVTIDMPDRHIAGNDIESNSDSTIRVDFDPPYRHFEGLGIAAQDMATGDRYAITNKDETGFDIRFFNSGGTGIVRTFDYVAKGWGKVVEPA